MSSEKEPQKFKLKKAEQRTCSYLPNDIVKLVSDRLISPLDRLRFRSVCSSWRSLCAPTMLNFPIRLPTPSEFQIDPHRCLLHVRTICVAEFPSDHCSAIWVGEIQHGDPPTKFLNIPLHQCQHSSTSISSNLLESRISEIGKELVLSSARKISEEECSFPVKKKVAILCLEKENNLVFLSYDITLNSLLLFTSSSNKWVPIRHGYTFPYCDIIAFNGKFYTVDPFGYTATVCLYTKTLQVVADEFTWGNTKFLVESCGELLIVDAYLEYSRAQDGSYFLPICGVEKFEVFKLDEVNKCWIPLECIGDRILFLGHHSNFAIVLSDYQWGEYCRGNYIVYLNDIFEQFDGGDGATRYDLHTGEFFPLS